MMAVPSWRKFDAQIATLARSRAWLSAGSNMPARMPMIAITTSSSIKVKALVVAVLQLE
jgi:hypothetical protein